MKRNSKRLIAFIVSAVSVFTFNYSSVNVFTTSTDTSQTVFAAQTQAIEDFDPGELTMLDEYCTNAFSKEISYLLSFDTERLLAGFRDNAGLSTNGAKRYDGWENSLIGGHSVGHYLSAVAQAYQNPLITAQQKDQLYSKMKTLIDGMKICQQNSKGKPGFLWAANKVANSGVEAQFDNVQNGQTNIITQAWVPWYTMHKLVAGIVDVYKRTGYEPAKDLASNLGDWVYNRCSSWNSQTHSKVLSVEYGGMNDCMYDLYSITGKETHAVAAHYFDETALFDRVLKGGSNVLNGKHANTTIPKFIGALKRYTVLGHNGGDESKYLQYAEAFWEMVRTHHTYITGGNSEWEHFGMDDVLDKERTNCNCETCNSYNMLKLSRELFKITGDSKYMDYYENTYYNSILSSQNPETGMTTYFQPMATGYFKVYSSPFNNFWCCTGSGMESFTKLGDTIYMHHDNSLYINMYQSSEINWKEKNVKITQNSSIPDGNTSKFTISGSADLDLRFRLPDWKAGNVIITVNGERYAYKTVDNYAQVTGNFKDGDTIELTIPLEVKAYSLPDSDDTYGFKYGPVVLSAELGTADMKKGTTGMNVAIPSDKVVASETIKINDGNGSAAAFMMDINKYLVKDKSSMTFTLNGTNTKLTFTPHYRQYQQRYGIYWKFVGSGSGSEEEIPRAKATVTDTVQPGYGQYENDDLHMMNEVNSVSVTSDSTYRYAENGGFFSYQMAVDQTAPYSILKVTFRKSDNGKTIKIKVGNTVLYRKTLDYSGDSDTYDVSIIVPPEVLGDNVRTINANDTTYDVITVTFMSDNSDESAKVCDFIYMTAVKPLYEYDDSIAYFVDCGDHNTKTVTGSDKFGYYNSVTEQLYGKDKITGSVWGLIDDPEDVYNGSSKSKGLYTSNTWANEFNTADNQDKANSNRYTKNQYENNIERHLDYGFTLPNGKYNVEIGFCDPWSCSGSPTVYANYGKPDQSTVVKDVAVSGNTTVKGSATVTDGTLSLNFRTESKAINVSYIVIKFDTLDPLPVESMETPLSYGDLNSDKVVDLTDLTILSQYLLHEKDLDEKSMKCADANGDGSVDITDLATLRQYVMKDDIKLGPKSK